MEEAPFRSLLSDFQGPDTALTARILKKTRVNLVNNGMTSLLLESLQTLLAVKRQRLTITRAPRSREILRREIRALQHQIAALSRSVL